MGNLSHDRCYGIDKSTQKSGYGELTNIPSPLGGEDEGEGEKIQNHPSRIERDGGKSER